MKYNKLFYSLLSFPLLITGCSSKSKKKEENKDNQEEKIKLVSVDLEQEVTQDNISNSIELFDLLCDEYSGNQLFSPLSLNFALGMLQEGASGETKDQINQYLGTDNYSSFASYYLNYAKEYYNSDEDELKSALEITNALFVNKNFEVLDSYTQKIQGYYLGDAKNLDFSNAQESADTINDWCNTKTHKLIPRIISPEDISQDLSIILANSLYFESGWADQWNAGGKQENFTNLDSSTTDLEYIYGTGDQYFENDYATAFSKYYRNGISFIGILPKQEGNFDLTDLNLEELLSSEGYATQINIKMPRLNYDSSFTLNEELQKLGIQDAFNNGDFSNLSIQGTQVSKILQKTKIELDEYGTKAAAVTAIMNECTSFIEEEPMVREVNLDRPFAYLIYDENAHQILFIGKVIKM